MSDVTCDVTSVSAEKYSVAPISTGRRPILSASMLKSSEPMSTPVSVKLATVPAELFVPHSVNSAGATKPHDWTSKPSMMRQRPHSTNMPI